MNTHFNNVVLLFGVKNMTMYAVKVKNCAGGPPSEWKEIANYDSRSAALARRHKLNARVAQQVGPGGRGHAYEVFAEGSSESINPYE